MDIYKKSRGIFIVNIAIILFVLLVLSPNLLSVFEFIIDIFVLLLTLCLINDNIFVYNEKLKKVTVIFTIFIIGYCLLLYFKNFHPFFLVITFLRYMLFFLAFLEAIFIVKGMLKRK